MIRLALISLCAAVVLLTGVAAAASPPAKLLHPSALHAKAPAVYRASFATTKGTFVVTVHRAWAPLGADRFYNLVQNHFFDGDAFFRVLKGFVVQFGISPDPAVSKAWQTATIKDDPVKTSNTPGTIVFADAGPQTSGMAVLQKLYGGYGEQASNDQQQIQTQGSAFLRKTFPKLDGIRTARILH
jgi:peptidyl-prolyl cis-trans isomerase A (cyclophilin A)